MRTIVRLGSRVPLHASGVGKALFAALGDEAIERLLARGLPQITPNTVTAPDALWASIRAVRARGWSFDDEEHLPGTRCVAASVYDEHAEPLCALSLAGPSSRLPDARIAALGPLVAQTAEAITRRLGGRWPHPR
jgi:IclR family acetate operon transcriptional repressor